MQTKKFNIIDFTKQKLEEYGLPEYSVTYNNRKISHGVCFFRTKTISFSRYTIPELSESQQKAVALHEVAHAIVGPRNSHNRVWKDTCLAIGGDGERVGPAVNAKELFAKWTATCPNCAKTRYSYHKDNYACGRCCKNHNNGKYDSRFKLVYTAREVKKH